MEPMSQPRKRSDKITVLYDAVVSKYRLDNEHIENPKDLSASATLNYKTVSITSSRINVTEFNPNKTAEMKTTIEQLQKNVGTSGLSIKMKVKGRVAGAGTLQFPSDVTERISEDMHDVIHSGVAILDISGDKVGEVEVICQLTIKCEETKPPIAAENEKVECQRNVDRNINPNDIMFVMATNSPNFPDSCADVLLPEVDDELLQLDLQRYQQIKCPPINTDSDMMEDNSAVNAATYELKQMSRECAKIVDFVTNCWTKDKQKAQTDSPCGGSVLSQTKANICNSFKNPNSTTDWFQPPDKPLRLCPICLTSMAWLPKFAACPTCGVSPLSIIDMNTKFTADQILDDCLGKS